MEGELLFEAERRLIRVTFPFPFSKRSSTISFEGEPNRVDRNTPSLSTL